MSSTTTNWWPSWHGEAFPSGAGGGSTDLADMTSVQNALSTKSSLGHTHPQSEVSSLATDLAAKEATANKGVANGYAGLNGSSGLNIGGPSTLGTLSAAASSLANLHVTGASTFTGGMQSSNSTFANLSVTGGSTLNTLTVTGDITSSNLSTKASLQGGLVPTGQLGTSAASSAVFLRGDQVWAAPTAAPAAWSTTRFDFGYVMLRHKQFTISDASVSTATRRIQIQQEANQEQEDNTRDSDPVDFRVVPGSTQFIVWVWGLDSPVGGIIQASYQVQ